VAVLCLCAPVYIAWHHPTTADMPILFIGNCLQPDTALRDFSTKEDMQRLPGASTRGLFVHKAAPTVVSITCMCLTSPPQGLPCTWNCDCSAGIQLCCCIVGFKDVHVCSLSA
jgi:hypothetical protein